MASFLTLFGAAVDICFWIIIIQVILSWLINLDVINLRQPSVWQVGIDIAPMIVLFGLYALQVVVYNNLGPLAYGG